MELYNADCLEQMQNIEQGSIDMILCDLPYECTHNHWDSIISFEDLWKHYNRIIKDDGAIVLFGQGVFSAKLICSNLDMYRYTLIWDKCRVTGFLNANRMPLRCHEDILVFYKKLPTYNPQKTLGASASHSRGANAESKGNIMGDGKIYGKYIQLDKSACNKTNLKCPTSIIKIPKTPKDNLHPTQKPVELLEYLINTYTNEGETVLDNCMGSGSTGIACLKTNRNFIGIEKEVKYFNIAKERIENFESLMLKDW